MIVLPLTSQVKYTIQDKEYTCYTPDENRKIAIIMLKGERDSIKSIACDKVIKQLSNQLVSAKKQSQYVDSIAMQLMTDNTELQQCYNQSEKQNKFFQNIIIGSTIVNILVITILIL